MSNRYYDWKKWGVRMKRFDGKAASSGIAIGQIWEIKHAEPSVEKKIIDRVDEELTRFETARSEAVTQLGLLYEKAVKEVGEDKAAVFEVHQMLLADGTFVDSVTNMIRDQKVSAEYAVSETGSQLAAIFEVMDDESMKARAADMKDIAGRVVQILCGNSSEEMELSAPSIIVTDDLTPSETIQMDLSKVLAFVTRQGSIQSHTAILARTMGIPALVGVPVPSGLSGESAIVDGPSGILYVNMSDEKSEQANTGERYDFDWEMLVGQYREQQKKEKEKYHLLQELKGRPVYKKDGKQMKLCANIGGVSDIDAVLANDADGIGLFRSEFLYLKSQDYPTEEVQFQEYKTVAEAMQGKQVIIRTLDIGADKKVDYFRLDHEENPALGYRAIRICLDREEIFRTQLRALYRASAFGNIAIMFPMITAMWEVKRAKKLAHEVESELKKSGIQTGRVEIGIMIETPAAVMLSEELAKEVDFFSIGTNDLTQYTLAADRQNKQLEKFYDTHHPAILKMIQMTVENAHKAGIRVGICGELAADVTLAQTFMEMGVDELSMSPSSILAVKQKLLL